MTDERTDTVQKEAPKRHSLGAAFVDAFRGIGVAIVEERNVKIDLVFAVLAIVLGFAFRVELFEWLAIVICIAGVLSAEIFNTALESAVDLACPHIDPKAKRAKDCAAGAVLVWAIIALVVAAIIFLPKIAHVCGLV